MSSMEDVDNINITTGEKKDAVAGGEYSHVRQRTIQCPHCDEAIYLGVQVRVFGVSAKQVRRDGTIAASGSTDTPVDDLVSTWRKSLNPVMVKYLDAAKSTGALDQFEACVRAHTSEVPNNLEKHFVSVLKTARPKLIPRAVLDALLALFPDGRIDYYSSQGVGIVVSDNRIRMFVPNTMALGESIGKPGGGKIRVRMDADLVALREWIRTKRGYVPNNCGLFMDALRKVSIGDFAKPAL